MKSRNERFPNRQVAAGNGQLWTGLKGHTHNYLIRSPDAGENAIETSAGVISEFMSETEPLLHRAEDGERNCSTMTVFISKIETSQFIWLSAAEPIAHSLSFSSASTANRNSAPARSAQVKQTTAIAGKKC